MAKTIVKPAHDIASLPATAAGNAPATGMPKNVAPDVISEPRASKSGYGQNSFAHASSLTPNDDANIGRSPLGANMKQAAGDEVLDTIIQHGSAAMRAAETGDSVEDVRGMPASQLRDVSNKGYPPAHGMASRQAADGSPGGTIPSKIGATSAPPVRDPSQG